MSLNSTILASNVITDYPYASSWRVIHAENASNICLRGHGTVDGQAIPLWIDYFSSVDDRFQPKTWSGKQGCDGECRPRLVQFVNCTDVLVQGVTLRNSPDWTSHYLGCKRVVISNIKVWGSMQWPNCDGIDPDSCVDVLIENVDVSTGDDSVCLKTTYASRGPCENITVINSRLRSKSSAIKFGSSFNDNYSNIRFENITIWGKVLCLQRIRSNFKMLCVSQREMIGHLIPLLLAFFFFVSVSKLLLLNRLK